MHVDILLLSNSEIFVSL
jgi:hypothetical protein